MVGRFVVFVAASMIFGGLLVEQTATAPGPAKPLVIPMHFEAPPA